jgi:hypothetical protein
MVVCCAPPVCRVSDFSYECIISRQYKGNRVQPCGGKSTRSTRDETVHVYLMGDDTDTLPKKVVTVTRGTRADNLLEVRQPYMKIGWVRKEGVLKKKA